MYKFGEFDSYQEMNVAAAGFLNEGDIESLKAMAEENGLDSEDVQDYIDGELTELATCTTSALGRMRVEQQAIMRKGKHLSEIYEAMKTEALVRAKRADRVGISCGADRQLEAIIRTYYLEPEHLKQHLEALYQEV